jgi:hypothetical protein
LKVHIRQVDGHTLVAKSDSNHWIPLDTGTAGGGSAGANDRKLFYFQPLLPQ